MPVDAVVADVHLTVSEPSILGLAQLFQDLSWLLCPDDIVSLLSPKLLSVFACLVVFFIPDGVRKIVRSFTIGDVFRLAFLQNETTELEILKSGGSRFWLASMVTDTANTPFFHIFYLPFNNSK